MSRYRRRDGDHPAYDPGACGPDGRAQCRRCLAALGAVQDMFCGPACRHEFLMRTSTRYARRAVYARDLGICTHCGVDCGMLDRVVARLRMTEDCESPAAGDALAVEFIAALGFGRRRRPTSLWQADHRIAVVEGGGECGLGNYRTLCLLCHRRVTRELRRRIAERRHG